VEDHYDIEEKFVGALALLHPRFFSIQSDCSPQQAIDQDIDSFSEFLAAGRQSSVLRAWQNQKCIVVTQLQARHPNFELAADMSLQSGWPVVVRRSGGSAVVHRPGVLNVSLQIGCSDRTSWKGPAASYEALLSLLKNACGILGVATSAGRAISAYCDGSSNLLFDGKKFAGTSAIIRQTKSRISQLVHASITIQGDVNADIAAVSAFERALGMEARYRADAMTSLEAAFAVCKSTINRLGFYTELENTCVEL